MDKLLVVDTETGGLDPEEHSILTLGCVIWTVQGVQRGVEIPICEPQIEAEEEALKVNSIDVEWLQKEGLTPNDAVAKLEEFVQAHFSDGQAVLAGHNVGFDISFMKRLYRLGGKDYDAQFSHRSVDTAAILMFLGLCGVIPRGLQSSDAAFEYFGIKFETNSRHTARADAEATAKLLSRMRSSVIRNGTDDS